MRVSHAKCVRLGVSEFKICGNRKSPFGSCGKPENPKKAMKSCGNWKIRKKPQQAGKGRYFLQKPTKGPPIYPLWNRGKLTWQGFSCFCAKLFKLVVSRQVLYASHTKISPSFIASSFLHSFGCLCFSLFSRKLSNNACSFNFLRQEPWDMGAAILNVTYKTKKITNAQVETGCQLLGVIGGSIHGRLTHMNSKFCFSLNLNINKVGIFVILSRCP